MQNSLSDILKQEVAGYVQDLSAEDPKARRQAAEVLFYANVEVPICELTQALNDIDTDVVENIAGILVRMGSKAEAAAPALIAIFCRTLLRDRHPERMIGFNATAIQALSTMGQEATELLLNAIKDQRPNVRYKSVLTLRRMRPITDKVICALTSAICDSDPWVRCEVVGSLSEARVETKEVHSALVNALQDPNDLVRIRAEYALRRFQCNHQPMPQLSVAHLVELLDDPDTKIRAKASETLGMLTSDAIPIASELVRRLQENWDGSPPFEIADALIQIGKHGSQVASLLSQALRSKNKNLRVAASMILFRSELASQSLHAQMIDCLKDEQYEVRMAALCGLDAIGKLSAKELPSIAALFPNLDVVLCPDLVNLRRRELFCLLSLLESMGRHAKDLVFPLLQQLCRNQFPSLRYAALATILRLKMPLEAEAFASLARYQPSRRCTIRHVKQRNTIDCGIAVIAMRTGVSYEEVRSRYNNLNRPMGYRHFLMILESLTRVPWRFLPPPPGTPPHLNDFQLTDAPLIVDISPSKRSFLFIKVHPIVIVGNVIHDPLFDCSFLLEHYPYRHFYVRAIVKPALEKKK